MSVRASAVAPAKPAMTFLFVPRRRTLRAFGLTTVVPSVTWPSPTTVTVSSRRTASTVVDRVGCIVAPACPHRRNDDDDDDDDSHAEEPVTQRISACARIGRIRIIVCNGSSQTDVRFSG